MAWNKRDGRPWDQWELDLLIKGRQQTPPLAYKVIVQKLPGRSWRSAHRVASDLGLTDWENSLTNRTAHKDKEKELFEAVQHCILDLRMTAAATRDYLENVKGIKIGRSTLAKRLAAMRNSTDKEEREVGKQALANAKHKRALRISLTRKRKYRNGEYDHMRKQVRGS